MFTFTVICRGCGHDQPTRVMARSASHPGGFLPERCLRCDSEDLVALRDLTRAELEEIEQAIKERGARP